MPTDHSYLPFAITTAGMCVPTYLLILLVNRANGMGPLLGWLTSGMVSLLGNLSFVFTRITVTITLIFAKIKAILAPRSSEKSGSADLEAEGIRPR